MNFAETIQSGWQRHEKETEAVAEEVTALVDKIEDTNQLVAFCALASHVIGQHLKDWSRAAGLLQQAIDSRPSEESTNARSFHAVCLAMSGDATGFLAADTAAMSVSDNPLAMGVRTRIMIAGELAEAKQYGDAHELYAATLVMADTLAEGHLAERAIAVTSNNLASALLEIDDRTDTQVALMRACADNARKYWLRVGDWTNDERADYLLALVHNSLGEHDVAKEFIARALKTIKDNGKEEVDEAFLHLALAKAEKAQGNQEAFDAAIAHADELMTGLPPGLQEWYQEDRAKVIG